MWVASLVQQAKNNHCCSSPEDEAFLILDVTAGQAAKEKKRVTPDHSLQFLFGLLKKLHFSAVSTKLCVASGTLL